MSNTNPWGERLLYGDAVYVPPAPAVRVSAVLGTTGDAVLSGGSTTYGTDRTTALQALISSYVGWQIIWDGKYSHTGLSLPGNTSIQFLPGCGSILRPQSPQGNLYQNANLSLGAGGVRGTTAGGDTLGAVGNITDTNITLRGGIHNCNVANQTASSQSSLLHGIRFWGVSRLTMDDMWIIDGSGPWLANAEYVTARGITCESVGHSAGPQVNGPARRIAFEDLTTIGADDDSLALNADDGDAALASFLPYPFGGPITDVAVRNLKIVDAPNSGIRVLSCSARVDRILFDGISGNTAGRWGIIDNFGGNQTGTFGAGNIGHITIRDVNIDMGTPPGGSPGGNESGTAGLFINCAFESIEIDGWRDVSPTYDYPGLYCGVVNGSVSGTLGSLKISNYTYWGTSAGHTSPRIMIEGPIQSVQVTNPTIQRADTIGPGASPLLLIDPASAQYTPATSGPTLVAIDGLLARNIETVVAVNSVGVSGLLRISGVHSAASGHAAVTVASGVTVANLDTRQLATAAVAGKSWSGAGSVTNDIDTSGTYSG